MKMIETIKRADFQLERDQQSGFGTLRTERGNLPLKKLEVQSQIQGLTSKTTVRQTVAEGFVTGSMFDMPAGEALLAAGVMYKKDEYAFLADPTLTATSNDPVTGSSRTDITGFNPELFNLAMSDGAKPLLAQVKKFIQEHIDPMTAKVTRRSNLRAARTPAAPRAREIRAATSSQSPCRPAVASNSGGNTMV